MKECLAIILAGGRGSRLSPLTNDRAKPAVPFGGTNRIIDFTMSNCLNSGLKRILMLTQYKSLSLTRHVDKAWRRFFCGELDEFVDVVPPQQRLDENWYLGTADAVYQNLYSIEKSVADYFVILAGDHIYKMDYQKLVEFHRNSNADLTIGALPVKREDARQFGVMQVQPDQRITGFEEKPTSPSTIPGSQEMSLASLGIYVFNKQFLLNLLLDDAANKLSSHDFGRDLIPSIINTERVFAYSFRDENRKETAYWRDVGTLDSYYEANMDLVAVDPMLNLYDRAWPIRTFQPNLPPPKFVFSGDQDPTRRGTALDSVIGNGSIVSGGIVRHSVLGHSVRVNSHSRVQDSILFNNVTIQRGAIVRRAIIDKHVCIPADTRIGVSREEDESRGLFLTKSGLVVVTQANVIGSARTRHSSGFSLPTVPR